MGEETLYPDYQLLEQLEAAGPFQAGACFQCRKCTNGCPVTFAMDLYPDEVIRMVILGQRQKVLHCRTIWVCASCETCTTCCPNEVKIAELMDCLKEMAVEEGLPCPQPQVLALHEAFLSNVRKRGRFFQGTFLSAYMIRSGELWRRWKAGTWHRDLKLAWQMLYKGRLRLFPMTIRGKKEVRTLLTHPKQRQKTS